MLTRIRRVAVRVALLSTLSLAAAPAQETRQPANGIQLTEAQKQLLTRLQAESTAKAARLMLKLPQAARSFNANVLAEKPDPELDRRLSREMADMFSAVIQLRIARIRESAQVLTREQKQALAEELKKPDAPPFFDDLVRKVLGDPKK